MAHPLWILSVLCLSVALGEWLVRHTWLHHLGSALLVIVLAATAVNLGIIPSVDEQQLNRPPGQVDRSMLASPQASLPKDFLGKLPGR